jgi:hypothetical protein
MEAKLDLDFLQGWGGGTFLFRSAPRTDLEHTRPLIPYPRGDAGSFHGGKAAEA